MNTDILKNSLPESIFNELPFIISKFNISTPFRMAHFLAQTHHESCGFKTFEENLNYSADRLLVIFPKYFTQVNYKDYHRKPEKIANRVYANRMGNGDEKSGDGYKFRGRGAIQLTGKNNYVAFGTSIGEDCVNNPDLVKSQALTSAAWFWTTNGLSKIADKGATVAVVTEVTKKVNGGTIGLPERIELFNKYYNLIK